MHGSNSAVMQKYPLRNRSNQNTGNASAAVHYQNRTVKQDSNLPPCEMPPQIRQRIRRICRTSPSGTSLPPAGNKLICNRKFIREPTKLATWDEALSVGSKSKSWLSPISSSLVDSNTGAGAAGVAVIPLATTPPETVKQTSAKILEVPGNATASYSNKNANGNRNKDDDDDNCPTHSHSRSHSQSYSRDGRQSQQIQQQQRITEGTVSAREFMTFEKPRMGDQINFLLFDPYHTLKFLITELKSRLRTVVPDDVNVQKIIVEIQQTMKRIQIPKVSKALPPAQPPSLPPSRIAMAATTTEPPSGQTPPATTSLPASGAAECILPKERCHVIKEGPLINHVRKVNSSCQTMEPQLENVNACQMCEHQVRQYPAGCNQKRENGNSKIIMNRIMVQDIPETGPQHRSQTDRGADLEMEKESILRSLQDVIENLKIKSNPSSDDTQKIITHLETELSNFQCKLQRTSCSSVLSSSLPEIKSTTENSKVQCKRLLDEQHGNQEEERTSMDFIAKIQPPLLKNHNNSPSSDKTSNLAAKEFQTKNKNLTEVLYRLEKEKLQVLQQFRASEMQSIEGDLNKLHVFIKDQLDDIYHSITQDHLNLKYHFNKRRSDKGKSNRQKTRQRHYQRSEKMLAPELPSSSSSLLTALKSSVPSSSELRAEVGVASLGSSISSQGHNKKSSHNSIAAYDGNANNDKSIMKHKQQQQQRQKPKQKQKLSSSLPEAASDAQNSHNISNVDKADKGFGEKESKELHNHYHQHPCNQQRLFAHINCCTPVFIDTLFLDADVRKRSTAVECEGNTYPHATDIDDKVQRMMTADAAKTSTLRDIKSTAKTSAAAMTCYQNHRQCRQQPTTMTPTAAKERTRFISSTLPLPLPYITMQSATDETAQNIDVVTNAPVRTIIENAYANVDATPYHAITTSTTAAEHSNGIRMQNHCQFYQSSEAHNSWQRVNLKNPTACQLKKQICGDRYEWCGIPTKNKNGNYNDNDNNQRSSNKTNGNRSKYPQIHDCQKCRANSINPTAGLYSPKIHAVGADNADATTSAAFATNPIAAAATTTIASGKDVGDRNDAGAGGDGPIYWNEGNQAAVLEDFSCHIGQRKQTEKLHNRTTKPAFPTDLNEFKDFLDALQ